MEIRLKPESFECGEGCCWDIGVRLFIDGEDAGFYLTEELALISVLTRLNCTVITEVEKY